MKTTEEQISFTVKYWVAKLRESKKVSAERLAGFEKALAKTLIEDREIRAVCAHFGPGPALEEALTESGLRGAQAPLREELFVLDIDLVMNPDGTVDIREDAKWRKEKT